MVPPNTPSTELPTVLEGVRPDVSSPKKNRASSVLRRSRRPNSHDGALNTGRMRKYMSKNFNAPTILNSSMAVQSYTAPEGLDFQTDRAVHRILSIDSTPHETSHGRNRIVTLRYFGDPYGFILTNILIRNIRGFTSASPIKTGVIFVSDGKGDPEAVINQFLYVTKAKYQLYEEWVDKFLSGRKTNEAHLKVVDLSEELKECNCFPICYFTMPDTSPEKYELQINLPMWWKGTHIHVLFLDNESSYKEGGDMMDDSVSLEYLGLLGCPASAFGSENLTVGRLVESTPIQIEKEHILQEKRLQLQMNEEGNILADEITFLFFGQFKPYFDAIFHFIDGNFSGTLEHSEVSAGIFMICTWERQKFEGSMTQQLLSCSNTPSMITFYEVDENEKDFERDIFYSLPEAARSSTLYSVEDFIFTMIKTIRITYYLTRKKRRLEREQMILMILQRLIGVTKAIEDDYRKTSDSKSKHYQWIFVFLVGTAFYPLVKAVDLYPHFCLWVHRREIQRIRRRSNAASLDQLSCLNQHVTLKHQDLPGQGSLGSTGSFSIDIEGTFNESTETTSSLDKRVLALYVTLCVLLLPTAYFIFLLPYANIFILYVTDEHRSNGFDLLSYAEIFGPFLSVLAIFVTTLGFKAISAMEQGSDTPADLSWLVSQLLVRQHKVRFSSIGADYDGVPPLDERDIPSSMLINQVEISG